MHGILVHNYLYIVSDTCSPILKVFFCFNLIVGIDSVKSSYTGLVGGAVGGYVLSVILLVVLVIQNVWILYHKKR